MKQQYKAYLMTACLCVSVLSGCQKTAGTGVTETQVETQTESRTEANTDTSETTETAAAAEYETEYIVTDWKSQSYKTIQLDGGSAEISSSGIYEVTGTLKDGALTVDIDKTVDTGTVYLVMNGVTLSSSTAAPVNIKDAAGVVMILAAGSTNEVSLNNKTADEADAPSGAVIAKTDLTIAGTGTLNIVSELKDGINGEGSVIISEGSLEITAGDDAIHADADMTIAGGKITILSSYEGIEGNNITIKDGTISLVSTDDGINVPSETGTLTIDGGAIEISAGGDGIDSNGNIVQNGGTVTIHTDKVGAGNSAVDYDGTFTANGGTIVDQDGTAIDYQNQQMGGGGRGQKPSGERGGTPPADGETPPADDETPPADGKTPPADGETRGTPPADGEFRKGKGGMTNESSSEDVQTQ